MFTMPSPSLEMRREIEMQSKRLEEMKAMNSPNKVVLVEKENREDNVLEIKLIPAMIT